MYVLNLENSLIRDRYLIERRIRCGHYTELFLGRDRTSGEIVIIKALNAGMKGTPDAALEQRLIQYFTTEAEVLRQLRHPNIIRQLDHNTAADLDGRVFHYLVLEYMAGGDLMRLCRGRPLTLGQALSYCRQVGEGLRHAHERGIIHRDIKPQNLLLDGALRQLKIGDFGIAKVLRGGDEEFTRGIGTENYAPPECFGSQERDAALTPSADIYSLAKTFYVMITGDPPAEFFQRPIAHFPPPVQRQSWAPALLRILDRATQHEPTQRFPTVDEFLAAIEGLQRSPLAQPMNDLDEETVIAVNIGRPGASPVPKREQLSSAVRVEIPLAPPLSQPPEVKPPMLATTAPVPAERKPADQSEPQVQRWARRGFVAGLAASFVACAFWIHSVSFSDEWRGQRGIATADLNLRAGPDQSFDSFGWIPEGTPVSILRVSRDERWYEVEADYWDLSEGGIRRRRGWVSRIYIKLNEG